MRVPKLFITFFFMGFVSVGDFGAEAAAEVSVPADSFDRSHAAWSLVLNKVVRGDRVDYAGEDPWIRPDDKEQHGKRGMEYKMHEQLRINPNYKWGAGIGN